jgi:D-alanine-D-alanine ligase
MTKKPKVAVLYGGWSNERSVSLSSGEMVLKALISRDYEAVTIDVTRDLKNWLSDIEAFKPAVIFNSLHGQGGEDGTVQAILDVLEIPYTHSGRLASAMAMDKELTKKLVERHGVRVAKGQMMPIKDLDHDPIPRPYVVKPNQEGSSVGVFIMKHGDNRDIRQEWRYGAMALIEEYIEGRELTVAVMQAANDHAKALTVTEIVAHQDFYNFEAKYAAGGSSHIVPADVPADVFEEAKKMAVIAHEVMGCSGVSRSDFRYDARKAGTAGLYFLEINNQPGMTPTSLVPEQAEHCGMNYADLVEWMVANATLHPA